MKPLPETLQNLLCLLKEERGKGRVSPPPEIFNIEASAIAKPENINPLVFFDRFGDFVKGVRAVYSGQSGERVMEGAQLSVRTFYDRMGKYAHTIESFRRSYWGVLLGLPFRSPDNQLPLLIYSFVPNPERKPKDEVYPPIDFRGLCIRCFEEMVGRVHPDLESRWFCLNCAQEITFGPHPLDWDRSHLSRRG